MLYLFLLLAAFYLGIIVSRIRRGESTKTIITGHLTKVLMELDKICSPPTRPASTKKPYDWALDAQYKK